MTSHDFLTVDLTPILEEKICDNRIMNLIIKIIIEQGLSPTHRNQLMLLFIISNNLKVLLHFSSFGGFSYSFFGVSVKEWEGECVFIDKLFHAPIYYY